MNISYDKTKGEYILGDTRYSKSMFLQYIESDMLQSLLADKPIEIEIKDAVGPDDRLLGAENVLLYGVPGAGKSFEIRKKYCSNKEYLRRVVFHPDYTYSDFVGQIMPTINEDQKLDYVFTPGPFTEILKKAYLDKKHYYYLVIEEINRGNAPAIFGELFQLLDRIDADSKLSERLGESEYGITNFDIAKEVYGDKNVEVKLPSNLYILATMNTADQNVFTLDTAFQRRWKMKHIRNDVFDAEHSNENIEGTSVSWGRFAYVINNLIIENNMDLSSSEDKRLGAYFVKKCELTLDAFPEKVLKYLWDDAFKMDRTSIFKEELLTLDAVIDGYNKPSSDHLKQILKNEVYTKMCEKNDDVE